MRTIESMEVANSGSSTNANVDIDGNGDPHSFSSSVVIISVISDIAARGSPRSG